MAEYLQSLSREEELRAERNRRLNEAFHTIDSFNHKKRLRRSGSGCPPSSILP
jgi:hypothetical protein